MSTISSIVSINTTAALSITERATSIGTDVRAVAAVATGNANATTAINNVVEKVSDQIGVISNDARDLADVSGSLDYAMRQFEFGEDQLD